MIWSTPPDLWGCISNSFLHVGTNPAQLLNIFEDILTRAQNIYAISENVVQSLTCDDLELPSVKVASATPTSVMNDISILVLKAQELNPSFLKAD
ncbi:hypothetical protein DSO57_1013739 [Entomophthora muscae]|uniref:Uncharacterized protein n=1 Tax=Entomophthora muscae TaxID=34485 RepID=A0ACC2URG1_9FUNG|nr:hypothetical protein DSO57_1013739 [Entomophthora muscae]